MEQGWVGRLRCRPPACDWNNRCRAVWRAAAVLHHHAGAAVQCRAAILWLAQLYLRTCDPRMSPRPACRPAPITGTRELEVDAALRSSLRPLLAATRAHLRERQGG